MWAVEREEFNDFWLYGSGLAHLNVLFPSSRLAANALNENKAPSKNKMFFICFPYLIIPRAFNNAVLKSSS